MSVAVVLDTNVYRGTGRRDFAELVSLERAAGIDQRILHVTARELLFHVADISDPSYGPALAAIQKIVQRCARQDGERRLIAFTAEYLVQLCLFLFDEAPESLQDASGIEAGVLGEIATNDSAQWQESTRRYLGRLRTFVETAEAGWAAIMWRIVQFIDPEATDWPSALGRTETRDALLAFLSSECGPITVAQGLAVAAARRLNRQLEAPELNDAVERLMQHYAAAIRFQIDLMTRIATDGTDMSRPRNANSSWDLEVLSGTIGYARLRDAPLWVVTDERQLLSAAATAGMNWYYRSKQDYLEVIQGGAEAVRRELDTEPRHT